MRQARLTGSNAHRVDYGAECVRNVLPERAEVEFNSILAVDPRNVNALNGLSAIALELVQAGKAEELFRRSLVIRQTDEAARGLAEAERMRNPERWTGYEKRRRKSWGHWRETQFPELTHEQRLKRMVEIVARRQ